MSPFTHAIAGAWTGYVAWSVVPSLRMSCSQEACCMVGALLGNAPDLDAGLLPFISAEKRTANPVIDHRGFSHSLWMLPIWGLFGAYVLIASGFPSETMNGLILLGIAAAAGHIGLDMVDGSPGVMIWAGIDNTYYRLPMAFVRDVDVLSPTHWSPGTGDVFPATGENLRVRFVQEVLFALLPLNLSCYLLIYCFMSLL